MTQSPAEKFWSLLCDFRNVIVLIWSMCLLFFIISSVLFVTGATNQEPILVVNLVILTPPLLVSAVVLKKCSDR